jgi:hypothetical protein
MRGRIFLGGLALAAALSVGGEASARVWLPATYVGGSPPSARQLAAEQARQARQQVGLRRPAAEAAPAGGSARPPSSPGCSCPTSGRCRSSAATAVRKTRSIWRTAMKRSKTGSLEPTLPVTARNSRIWLGAMRARPSARPATPNSASGSRPIRAAGSMPGYCGEIDAGLAGTRMAGRCGSRSTPSGGTARNPQLTAALRRSAR